MKVLSLLFCLVYLNLANDLPAGCGFKLNGKSYDLSGLQAIMPTDGFASSDGLSRMGMCGNNVHTCNGEESFLAVFGDSRLTNCVVMLAKWEKPTASALPAGSDGKIPDGILLKLPTGDPCPTLGSQPNYEVDVRLICDETTDSEPFTLKQIKVPCTFGATMHTKHACPTASTPIPTPAPTPQSIIPPWKNQWQATQIIHIPELDADQSGWFVYDYANQRIRQDQFTFRGSVPSYSKNMTEFFFGTDWYFIDWVANTCESTTYGIGPVKPDWFITNSTLQKNVFLYDRFEAMTYVNTTWLYLDWFGIFEYFVSEKLEPFRLSPESKPFRLRMPGATSLAGMTLVVDFVNYTEKIDESLFDLPEICKNPKPIDVFTFKKRSRGWYGNLAEKFNKQRSNHNAFI